jgi:hypothetical protein
MYNLIKERAKIILELLEKPNSSTVSKHSLLTMYLYNLH